MTAHAYPFGTALVLGKEDPKTHTEELDAELKKAMADAYAK